MIEEQHIRKSVRAYVQKIFDFEIALMDRYDLQDNPFLQQQLFPKSGSIDVAGETAEYRFHGAGCSFTATGTEVHYNYLIDGRDYIATSPWNFWRFVVTWSGAGRPPRVSVDEVAGLLAILAADGILEQVRPGYLEYRVNLDRVAGPS